MSEYAIGDLSAATGCKVETIRYYEHVGLMPKPPRTAGGQRRYSVQHLQRLTFIRHSRELGFEIDAIRQLLKLADNPERPCDEVDKIAKRHLSEINGKIERLTELRLEMSRIIRSCAKGRISECRIISALAEHPTTASSRKAY